MMLCRRVLTMALMTLAVVIAMTGGRTGQAQSAAAGQVPLFEADPAWPRIPNDWVLGTVTSVAVGTNDHVWVIHRPRSVAADRRAKAAPPVLEFDAAGTFVRGWGGDNAAYDWPSAEHGIFLDHQNNIWITGSNPSGGLPDQPTDNMVLKFTSTGQFLRQLGGRGKPGGNAETTHFERAADVAVFPPTNELFVADGYGNRRVAVFDADSGAFKRMWGAFGKAPDTAPPAPLGPPPPSTQGSEQEQPEGAPLFANPVHSVRISRDGLVYVADRTNRRIQVFKTSGEYVTQVFINRSESPSACGMAFSPDPAQRFLYVADYGNSRLVVLDRQTLTVLYQFGGRGPQPGQFQGLHQLSADAKGNLYAVEVAPGNRVQKFIAKGFGAPPSR